LGIFHRHAQQLVAGLHQLLVPQAAPVLQLHVETVGKPQFQHRRGGKGEGESVTDFCEGLHGTTGNGLSLQFRRMALLPVL
jgi:hypothetical protein